VLFTACGGGQNRGDGGNGNDGDDNELPWKPANPVEVAPPVNQSVAYDIYEDTSFIYANAAIQQDLDPNLIERRRVAVLRGLVRDENADLLEGVRVTF